MNYEKFLPIGTVVLLKDGQKRVMITGFCTSSESGDNSKMYDYSACLYPEGIVKSDEILLFNHEQISKIFYIGLRDNEEIEFKQNLKKALEQYNEEKNNSNNNIDTLEI